MKPDHPQTCPFCNRQGLVSKHCIYCNVWVPPDKYPPIRWRGHSHHQEEATSNQPDTTPPLTGNLQFPADDFFP